MLWKVWSTEQLLCHWCAKIRPGTLTDIELEILPQGLACNRYAAGESKAAGECCTQALVCLRRQSCVCRVGNRKDSEQQPMLWKLWAPGRSFLSWGMFHLPLTTSALQHWGNLATELWKSYKTQESPLMFAIPPRCQFLCARKQMHMYGGKDWPDF